VNAGILVGLLALSTTLTCALTTRNEPHGWFRAAGVALCEFAGLWTVSLIVNIVLGVAAILAVRSLTPFFVSIYVLNDVSLAICSGLQGFLLYWLRHHRPTRAA
jgi:hypothetical protein